MAVRVPVGARGELGAVEDMDPIPMLLRESTAASGTAFLTVSRGDSLASSVEDPVPMLRMETPDMEMQGVLQARDVTRPSSFDQGRVMSRRWEQPSRVLGALPAVGALLLLATAAVACGALQRPEQPAARRQGAAPVAPGAPGLPVFMMHGLIDWKESFQPMQQVIWEARPGTLTIPAPLYENRSSITDLHTQVRGLMDFIRKTVDGDPARFRHGYDLVCFSQGALICRAAVQEMDDHNVQTFVSLAGPHQGVYGPTEYWWKYIATEINIGGSTLDMDSYSRTELFYRPYMQSVCSVANMWHDPNLEADYRRSNTFLPLYNGLTDDPQNARRRANFLRLKRAHFTAGGLLGQDGDGIVEPARSASFEYYRGSTREYVPMQEQELYIRDTFGLRGLDEQSRLNITVVDGVRHGEWMTDRGLHAAHVLPFLTPQPPPPRPPQALWS